MYGASGYGREVYAAGAGVPGPGVLSGVLCGVLTASASGVAARHGAAAGVLVDGSMLAGSKGGVGGAAGGVLEWGGAFPPVTRHGVGGVVGGAWFGVSGARTGGSGAVGGFAVVAASASGVASKLGGGVHTGVEWVGSAGAGNTRDGASGMFGGLWASAVGAKAASKAVGFVGGVSGSGSGDASKGTSPAGWGLGWHHGSGQAGFTHPVAMQVGMLWAASVGFARQAVPARPVVLNVEVAGSEVVVDFAGFRLGVEHVDAFS